MSDFHPDRSAEAKAENHDAPCTPRLSQYLTMFPPPNMEDDMDLIPASLPSLCTCFIGAIHRYRPERTYFLAGMLLEDTLEDWFRG